MLLNITYIGEHLLPGILGHVNILLALASALAAMILYLLAEIKNKASLKLWAKSAYLVHFVALLTASITLFYILFNQYYEYDYVWKHTASYLPFKFIVSAFWAGQEGSFLLWILIEAILGMIVFFKAGVFENRVMAVISGAQAFLTTLVTGIKPFGIILGQNPFALLRDNMGSNEVEFFSNANYLSMISDGNGINPLLENVWMVTHPPLLFLGYSAALIPFAYAMAALWKRDYQSWLKPAFPWMIFAIISLGGGILLGGAWAYESLTFGGFWAWDPVENASLIPWLFLVAAMHMMILNKRRNHSYALSFVLVILSFFLVIYASYLTRSGVLGETSAHAFGNNGLSTQMIIIMSVIVLVSGFLYVRNYRAFPAQQQEHFLSREFWMYLGAIILVLSAVQIGVSTSIPVINKVFGTAIAPPLEREAFYNQWQLPFAVLILTLTSISLVLRYGTNEKTFFLKNYGLTLGISALLFLVQMWFFGISKPTYLLLLYSINLAIVGSIQFYLKNRTGSYNLSNTLSHLGLGIFMLGVLVAFSNSKIISSNTSKFDLGDPNSNRENQILVKGKMTELNDYWVQYTDLKKDKNHLFYTLDFYQKNAAGNLKKQFTLTPSINVNNRMGNVYDPDTYHHLTKDVFTYLAYADIMADMQGEEARFKEMEMVNISTGDSIRLLNDFLVLDTLRIDYHGTVPDVNNVAIIADLQMISPQQTEKFSLTFAIENGALKKEEKLINGGAYRIRFQGISTQKGGIQLGLDKREMDFIVIKATEFPYISLLLLGATILFIGLGISLVRNIRKP